MGRPQPYTEQRDRLRAWRPQTPHGPPRWRRYGQGGPRGGAGTRACAGQAFTRFERDVGDLTGRGIDLIEGPLTPGIDLDGVVIAVSPRLDARGGVGAEAVARGTQLAFRHLDLYDRFGCPGGHIQAAFRCLTRFGAQIDPKVAETLDSRVHACWINPAAQPQQAARTAGPHRAVRVGGQRYQAQAKSGSRSHASIVASSSGSWRSHRPVCASRHVGMPL